MFSLWPQCKPIPQCAGNRRTSQQQKILGKSASELSAARSASTLLGAVAMNALLLVARRDMSRLAISTTKRIQNCTNISARRAGRGSVPVPVVPPPPNAPSQSQQRKTEKTSKTSLRKPAWKESKKHKRRGRPISPLLRVLSSVAGTVVEDEEEERVVTSKKRARLPRIPPPRRKRNRRIWGRKRKEQQSGKFKCKCAKQKAFAQ